MMRKEKNETQLSLFENLELPPEESTSDSLFSSPKPRKKASILDFARARFEQDKPMDQEEYKKWIKFLIHHSLKSID
jgi:hypothetical protein